MFRPRAAVSGGHGQRRCIAGGRQHIRADVSRKGFGHGNAFDVREVGGDTTAGHHSWQYGTQIRDGILNQPVHIGTRLIPFQHGELG